jgi:hypothetical protein
MKYTKKQREAIAKLEIGKMYKCGPYPESRVCMLKSVAWDGGMGAFLTYPEAPTAGIITTVTRIVKWNNL